MAEIGAKFIEIFSNFNLVSVIDILLMAVLFQMMFYVAKKYNSTYFNKCVVLALAISLLAVMFSLKASSIIIKFIVISLPLLFVLVFRSELKREIWKKSRADTSSEVAVSKFTGSEFEIRECIQKIIRAAQNMSKKNVGALIVIIPSKIPMQIAESGVFLNADLSSEIIENIFTPNTPLHDGAMLISGNKILAAGCFLPLTQEQNIPKDLGTRHRAGIGITEMTDVLSIIVSEETGVISVVRRGVIRRYADVELLTSVLEQIYGIKEYHA